MSNLVKVSASMLFAGDSTYEQYQESLPSFLLVEELYKSMELARRLDCSHAKDEKALNEVRDACLDD